MSAQESEEAALIAFAAVNLPAPTSLAADNGQPYRLSLLHALASASDDPDSRPKGSVRNQLGVLADDHVVDDALLHLLRPQLQVGVARKAHSDPLGPVIMEVAGLPQHLHATLRTSAP